MIDIRQGYDRMDVGVIHRYLSEESYWAKGISKALVNESMKNSFCVGAFDGAHQVGFGRVITDYCTFGWFADFFVLETHRGQGISKQMIAHIFEQSWSSLLRRIMLNTSSAQGLYRQFGFGDLGKPEWIQELYRPNVHLELR